MKPGEQRQSRARLTRMARELGGMLSEADPGRACWNVSDGEALLRHQLDARLDDDLSLCFADARAVVARSGFTTFGELLRAADPPVPPLRMVRQFAKMMSQKKACYPEEVALVLYYAAIAAAQVRAGAHITRLSSADFRRGCRWCLARAWLDPSLRDLFAEAIA